MSDVPSEAPIAQAQTIAGGGGPTTASLGLKAAFESIGLALATASRRLGLVIGVTLALSGFFACMLVLQNQPFVRFPANMIVGIQATLVFAVGFIVLVSRITLAGLGPRDGPALGLKASYPSLLRHAVEPMGIIRTLAGFALGLVILILLTIAGLFVYIIGELIFFTLIPTAQAAPLIPNPVPNPGIDGGLNGGFGAANPHLYRVHSKVGDFHPLLYWLIPYTFWPLALPALCYGVINRVGLAVFIRQLQWLVYRPLFSIPILVALYLVLTVTMIAASLLPLWLGDVLAGPPEILDTLAVVASSTVTIGIGTCFALQIAGQAGARIAAYDAAWQRDR